MPSLAQTKFDQQFELNRAVQVVDADDRVTDTSCRINAVTGNGNELRVVTDDSYSDTGVTGKRNGVIVVYEHCRKNHNIPVPDGWMPTDEYVTYHCAQCRCPVHYKEWQRNAGQRHDFCSYRCHNDYYMERRRERLRIAREKVCDVCETEFQAARTDSKYCSHACKQRAFRQRQRRAT